VSVEIKARKLHGPWDGGYALDIHTLSSTFLGNDNYGHPRYETTHSPVGELLYRLKYKDDLTAVSPLVDSIEIFWGMSPRPTIDLIVPAPPSETRKYQPVILVATALGERLKLRLCTECLSKVKETPPLKDVGEDDKRMTTLEGAFTVAPEQTEGRDILLFDDVYRSGATVRAITTLLKREGKAKAVRLLTLTQTRRKS
jgi:competence protein ComFC